MQYQQQWLSLAERQARADANTFPRADEKPEPVVVSTPCTDLSPETQRLLQRVVVTSQGYLAALDITPSTEKQAAQLRAILERGPTYESCALFQGRAV